MNGQIIKVTLKLPLPTFHQLTAEKGDRPPYLLFLNVQVLYVVGIILNKVPSRFNSVSH